MQKVSDLRQSFAQAQLSQKQRVTQNLHLVQSTTAGIRAEQVRYRKFDNYKKREDILMGERSKKNRRVHKSVMQGGWL